MEDWVEEKNEEGDKNPMLSSLLNQSFHPSSIPLFQILS